MKLTKNVITYEVRTQMQLQKKASVKQNSVGTWVMLLLTFQKELKLSMNASNTSFEHKTLWWWNTVQNLIELTR